MKNILMTMSWLALFFLFISCEKSDEFQKDFYTSDDINFNLQSSTQKVNSLLVELHKLLNPESVVVGVTHLDDRYVVELSDGSSFPLTASFALSEVSFPLITIDDEAQWVYSVDGGRSFNLLLNSEGAPLSSIDKKQIVPAVEINNEGCFVIKTAADSFQLLRDNRLNPIKADVTTAASFYPLFKSINYDSKRQCLKLRLQNNRVVELPVCDTFNLVIEELSVKESFGLKQQKSFKIHQERIDKIDVRSPKGWQVELTESELSILSPSHFDKSNALAKIDIVITSPEGYIKVKTIEVEHFLFAVTNCEAWNNYLAKSDKNVLLDFSYAGYQHGEVAPPDVESLNYKRYDVTDYGAIANDGKSDRSAFEKVIKKIMNGQSSLENARAIIYFPEGDFILHSEENNKNGQSHTLSLNMGGVILKGAGRDKTTLKMTAPCLPANSNILYSSPIMLKFKHNSGLKEVAAVTKDASQGSFQVEVASTANIRKGDFICLKLENNDKALIRQELAPYQPTSKMENILQKGVQVYDYHQVVSVKGRTITFKEPLLKTVESKWGWKICKYPNYQNIGVEDLTFEGAAKADFKHHGSWQDDGAYKPLHFVRVTHSWLRRVDFKNVSEAASFVSSANCSAYSISIYGNRGHSAIRSQGSSRIFIGDVVDCTDGPLVDPMKNNQYVYRKGAGQYHACGVSKQSMGAVIWKVNWGNDACFESHATQPRATLIDCCEGGFMPSRQGGHYEQMPNHLENLTLWNFNSKNNVTPFNFIWWDENSLWWKFMPPIVVGFHGGSVKFDEEQTKLIESCGAPVEPNSLYEAQLKERLGYLPSWISALK